MYENCDEIKNDLNHGNFIEIKEPEDSFITKPLSQPPRPSKDDSGDDGKK